MASGLPDFVASAKPVPLANRMPWYKSTAQTYAGIMLWFVFWMKVPGSGVESPAGILGHGLGVAILGVVVAALICHFACYIAPGMMGMKTGLPLAVVGTSTYGVLGGFLMPGFFMGILQFGWLAVNSWFSAELLAGLVLGKDAATGSGLHLTIGVVWAVVAAFVGLKGIQYVAKVATYLPLIPLVILLILAAKTIGGVGRFDAAVLTAGATNLPSSTSLLLFAVANIVGFFATAGAAGVDIASSNRDAKDVQMGGLVGVAGATIFTGCLALLIVAGSYGLHGKEAGSIDPTKLMDVIMGKQVAQIFWLLLALAAFPPACFSSLIAANSFKNTLPKVNPFISCGIGTAASVALILLQVAGKAEQMFGIIGASFGPICGAMTADYLLAGRKWPGPRAGFNWAGWISWAVGFFVGAIGMIAAKVDALSWFNDHPIPCPPVAAIIVGFVLYIVLAKAGLESETLEMPNASKSEG